MGNGVCRECRGAMTWTRKPKIFCSAPCRQAHTNRRRDRGEKLYDLFMALRYKRDAARRRDVWTKLCRLAESFRDEDVASGIDSTLPLDRQLEKMAHLSGQKLVKVIRRADDRRPE